MFMTWMGVVLFDSTEMRKLMQEAAHITMAGPYMLYLVGIADLMMYGLWADIGFWISIVVMIAYTIGSVIYAAIFMPKVIHWIENQPIKDYPAPSSASQELIANLHNAFAF